MSIKKTELFDQLDILLTGWKADAIAFDRSTRIVYKKLRQIVDPFNKIDNELSSVEKLKIHDAIGKCLLFKFELEIM